MKRSTLFFFVLLFAIVGIVIWLLGESSPNKLERKPVSIPVELPQT